LERLGDRHGDGLKGAVDVARNSRRANGSSEKASRLTVRSSATMYTWPFAPCCPCASLIIQVGIRRARPRHLLGSMFDGQQENSHFW